MLQDTFTLKWGSSFLNGFPIIDRCSYPFPSRLHACARFCSAVCKSSLTHCGSIILSCNNHRVVQMDLHMCKQIGISSNSCVCESRRVSTCVVRFQSQITNRNIGQTTATARSGAHAKSLQSIHGRWCIPNRLVAGCESKAVFDVWYCVPDSCGEGATAMQPEP